MSAQLHHLGQDQQAEDDRRDLELRSDRDNRIAPISQRGSTRRFTTSEILSYLWLSLPTERKNLRIYLDRAKSYRNDCGCAMGGIFIVGTLAVLLIYGFVYRNYNDGHWFLQLIFAAACLFAAALLGKMTGIGIARLKLIFLGRELRRRYQVRDI